MTDILQTAEAHQGALKSQIENELRFEPFSFEESMIAGIPVYAKHFSFAPCIHMRIGFRYGAFHDEHGKEGTAHFLEHAIFDGSSMFADEKATQEFGKTVLLDSLNAFTGLFELFITGECLPHNFEKALDGIFSMVLEPKLTEKTWAHEQKVITQEAWGRFLNEKRIAYIKKERENTLYDIPHRLRLASAIGWPETILHITHEDIIKAHATYFVKENMEIFIAGNIDAIGGMEKLKSVLHEFLIKMPSGEKANIPEIPHAIGGPQEERFEHTYEETGMSPRQQASVSLSSTIPRLHKKADEPNDPREDAHLATLSLASDLLADLVFRKLRLENSWCYGAGAGSSVCLDYLSFNMGGSIDFHHIDEAIAIMWGIVDDIRQGSDDVRSDFEKTKRLAIDNTMAKERTTSGIIESVVESMKVHGKVPTLKDWLIQIADVGFEDVQKVVEMYLAKEKVFTEIIRPDDATLAAAL